MKTILLVDDEPDMLKVITMRLTKEGFTIVIGLNGEEAVNLAKSKKPDLILMDYRMPVLNGLEACQRIKKDADLKHIPIIIMTASQTGMSTDAVKAVSGDDLIFKPFAINELLEKIRNFLNMGKGE